MSDVKEAAVADPQQVARHRDAERTSHRLMESCHTNPTSTHAAEWWKKAHANAIQAMPDEIRAHDSVKGHVGTTLWDVAHASLDSRGQKGSVKHEMQRLADLNHISVDCNDLRGKEIHLHAAKPAQCPPEERSVPLPPHRPAELAPPVPLPPHRPAELAPPAPLPPRRVENLPPEPHVITAPEYVDRGRPLPPPPGPEDWDRRGFRPAEPCHQPNPLDIFGAIGQGLGLIPRERDCRFGGPPPQDYYGGPRPYDGGYDNGIGAGAGLNLGLNFNLGAGLFGGGPHYRHREEYENYNRASSFPIGGSQTYQEVAPMPAPMQMHRQHMQRYSSAPTQTMEPSSSWPQGSMQKQQSRR